MSRRRAWAALAVVMVVVAGAAAWIAAPNADDAATTQSTAEAPRRSAAPPQAARRPDDPIPFSPSRTPAAPAEPSPGMAHKTPPAQPLPRAPMRSVVAGLLQQANAKPPNAEAAISAYEILTQCRRLAQNPPGAPDAQVPDCSGLTEADWHDAARLLKLAAELGNERAQLTYAQRMIGLGRDPSELASNREELSEANQKARDYLNVLAERGNVDGMWFLGESLRHGETSEQNLTMAYAYKYAVARAGGYPYTIDSELARLESQLSAQDQARARDFADRLIARCCSRPR